MSPPVTSLLCPLLGVGMAGSGKTTLLQRLNSHLHAHDHPPYIINLDPAVHLLPYGAHVDIRDTVQYKSVMQEYGLGPNGAIMTSLNLFATRFDQVLNLLHKPRDPPLEYIIADTPGQIEVFTWSASGAILTEALANDFPNVILFVVDTPRALAPQTFMSNMLQACSILYRTRLPLVLVFNKVDVASPDPCLQWVRDYDAFHDALEEDPTYAATLARSLSLALDEFYSGIQCATVSAVTGQGMEELFRQVDVAAQQYRDEYVPDLEARRKVKADKEAAVLAERVAALRADMSAAREGVGAIPVPVEGNPLKEIPRRPRGGDGG